MCLLSRFRGVSRIFERNFKKVSGMFEWCFQGVSKKFQKVSTFKSVSKSFKDISQKCQGYFKEDQWVSWAFERSLKSVSGKGVSRNFSRSFNFQECFKKCQGYFTKVSSIFWGRLKCISREFSVGFMGIWKNFKEVSKVFQGCFK